MNCKIEEIIIAAYLHDVGKFAHTEIPGIAGN